MTKKPLQFRINFRLRGRDAERFEVVWNRVMRRTMGEGQMTHVMLELIGLREPHLITQEDRQILAHGTDAPLLSCEEMERKLASQRKRKMEPQNQSGME